jgi:hypothetical protein
MEEPQEPDRVVVFEDQGQAFDMLHVKARRGEPGQVKPHREMWAGDSLHRDTGERVRVERDVDRDQGRYRERITDPSGNVIREVEEPLRDHRGRGAAKRQPPTDPAA